MPNAYNPAKDLSKRIPKKLTKELAIVSLCDIICLEQTGNQTGIETLEENGLESFCYALSEGYTWNDIASHLSISPITIRRHWYQALSADDKALIAWSETENAKKLGSTVLKKMFDQIDDEGILNHLKRNF